MVGMWDTDAARSSFVTNRCVWLTRMVNPIFSADGKTVVTLSGAFWNAMDTVRAWDVSLARPAARRFQTALYGKEIRRPGCADLADAVAGMKIPTEDDEESAPTVLSDLRKKYAENPVARRIQAGLEPFLWQRRSMTGRSAYSR